MLKKFFATLAFETLPLATAQAAGGAAQIAQHPGVPEATDRSESQPIPGLLYRREAVSKFFSIHS